MKKLLSFILSVLLSALLALPCIAQSPKESVRASQGTRQLRFEGATVHLFKDEKCEEAYASDETIPMGTRVYYSVILDEGYS